MNKTIIRNRTKSIVKKGNECVDNQHNNKKKIISNAFEVFFYREF